MLGIMESCNRSFAARCGNNEAVQAFLDAGANPNLKDGEGLCAYSNQE